MLAPYQQRVVEERDELEIKYKAICDFLESEFAKTLPRHDYALLRRQEVHMECYLNILNARIRRFNV